jgi:DNA-binding PadR family transcriptional regulator
MRHDSRPWAEQSERFRSRWRDFRDFWRDIGDVDDMGAWGGGRRGGRPGGRRDRMERGMLRYLILDALKDGPKHGYEIIKRVEEKTDGGYAPSPGTVYPTLQLLEDMGLVRSESQQERRVYQLTDAGRTELESKADEVEAVWSRFGGRLHVDFDLQELGFLRSEVGELLKTTFQVAFRGPLRTADPATMREVRLALERCKTEIREIGSRAGRGDRPAEPAQPNGSEAQGTPTGPSGTTERF